MVSDKTQHAFFKFHRIYRNFRFECLEESRLGGAKLRACTFKMVGV